mmetsp:Transcript_38378/g.83365  ORF Transcript_38378/g.83365 Transcript_38378/m.83365 type:complete len:201 (-) Transcript_38378:345-947(-)
MPLVRGVPSGIRRVSCAAALVARTRSIRALNHLIIGKGIAAADDDDSTLFRSSICDIYPDAPAHRRQFSSTNGVSSGIKRIDQTTLPTMSQAVVHNGVVHVSGQIDAAGEDVESQTRNILSKIDSLLQQAGTSKSKLLTASIWLKDIERDFATMNGIWLEWVDDGNKPARATTEANLAFPNLLVEIQVSAVVDPPVDEYI